ncbi:MAG TPA: carboxyl transferase domain-containing protein, partial [Candidatus Eisenbacteria bacterium]|nr:carboxyl transferase domain-containing protein [Candidatus Eisenbacteria bacterium]
LALQRRTPIIGVDDPGEPGADAGMAALAGFAGVLSRKVRASGVVPQLSVVTGARPGGETCSAALADFVFTAAGMGGGAHFRAADEAGCWRAVRALLSYLPAHAGESPPFAPADDPHDRAEPELQALAAGGPGAYDVREVVPALLDDGRLLEVQPHFAGSLLVGFGRLGGHAVGMVANQPGVLARALDAGECAKAARFVRTCDAFNVPLVSLVGGPGFPAGAAGRAAAQLVYACGEAAVPRLAVIARSDPGVLWSRRLGADLVLAWPGAVIGGVDVYAAAERGAVDAVIEPRETRRALVRGLELCLRKTVERPAGRHGNIPL